MESENNHFKIIAAAVLGAAGGWLLASYLCRVKDQDKPLSVHLNALVRVLEQFEGTAGAEAENLRERIDSILNTIESTYGNSEE